MKLLLVLLACVAAAALAEDATQPPKPETKEVKPETKEVKPETKEVKPETKEVKPEILTIQPETKDAKPQTLEVKPETKEVKPQTLPLKPETREVKPQVLPIQLTKDIKPQVLPIQLTKDIKPQVMPFPETKEALTDEVKALEKKVRPAFTKEQIKEFTEKYEAKKAEAEKTRLERIAKLSDDAKVTLDKIIAIYTENKGDRKEACKQIKEIFDAASPSVKKELGREKKKHEHNHEHKHEHNHKNGKEEIKSTTVAA